MVVTNTTPKAHKKTRGSSYAYVGSIWRWRWIRDWLPGIVLFMQFHMYLPHTRAHPHLI